MQKIKLRAKLQICGVVQGVGFRPFVFRLANRHSLCGYIANTSQGVDIEVEGEQEDIVRFIAEMQAKQPPLAQITEINTEYLPLKPYASFVIRESTAQDERSVLISPDISICADCLKELFDPEDRRYLYPFINCTNCGPRYTIIKDIPYDREKTSMQKFVMCPQCAAEYHDPRSRRFHAQPNACPLCGPEVKLVDEKGNEVTSFNPIGKAIELLQQGKVLAIKGLGGYHLAVDATADDAVSTLRQRKRREEKPLALMCLNIEAVEEFAWLSEAERDVLCSPQRPIVLLRKRKGSKISACVSPRNKYFGVMLPYTPLHYLLFQNVEKSKPNFLALVMTSGNITDEPIAIDNQEAQVRLGGIADYFLTHNRDIYLRSDDSVLRVSKKRVMFIRRSRGFVPKPIFIKEKMQEILACGAELKNTICLTKGRCAFLSQHIGDLQNLETLHFFELTVRHLQRILQIKPAIIAYDLHPDYLSTKFALTQKGVKLIAVQHHHAHLASCMAENSLDGEIIGFALDGTGYGEDGHIWGGEVFVGNLQEFKRVAHFAYVPLPGGEKAIEEPWRMALSYLYHSYGDEIRQLDNEFIRRIDKQKLATILKMMQAKINCPLTSSCGRIFDGVAALIGIRDRVVYEGQAAQELEMAMEEDVQELYPCEFSEEKGEIIISTRNMFKQIMEDLRAGESKGRISAKFHNSLVSAFTRICKRIREKTGLNRVVLSGGVFQNVYLTKRLKERLEKENLEVYTHSQVPPNDGGISLGQAVIANRKRGLS